MLDNWTNGNTFWTDFSNKIKTGNRFHVDEEFLQIFDRIIDNSDYVLCLPRNTVLYRARIHVDDKKEDRSPYEQKQMGPPPRNKQSSERLNPVGINYLYLAREIETCIYEVKPIWGNSISICDSDRGFDEDRRSMGVWQKYTRWKLKQVTSSI